MVSRRLNVTFGNLEKSAKQKQRPQGSRESLV
jgi:hypothetical protein